MVDRKGTRWAKEASRILKKFFNTDYCYYQGLQSVAIGDRMYTAGVFELDKCLVVTQDFINYIENYSSEYIKGIIYREIAGSYTRAVIVLL